MKEVVRITIKGSSGYGPYDEAYEDRVTISPDSIRYEYIPKVESAKNMPRKWSYKTTSPAFQELFRKTAAAVEEILSRTEEDFTCDIGMTSFMLQYADKTRRQNEFFSPADVFKECFAIIKQMVPGCEEIPTVLMTSDDRSIK